MYSYAPDFVNGSFVIYKFLHVIEGIKLGRFKHIPMKPNKYAKVAQNELNSGGGGCVKELMLT